MTHHRRYTPLLATIFGLMPSATLLAQSTSPQGTASNPTYEVTQVAGLPEAKPGLKGQLTMTDIGLLFTNQTFKVEIPFARMRSVSTGDVRVETGGTTGQIARKAIPFGGGMALAALTQKSADLLTVEFADLDGGYHGIVFFVPKSSAKALNESLSSHLPASTVPLPVRCEGKPLSSNSILAQPVLAQGSQLPAEYRVLLYEGLMTELPRSTSGKTYIRFGSSAGAGSCPAMNLRITVTGFQKGNQALRAATGPIGLFVGKTSVSFHIDLTTADGHKLLTEDMTSSKRMDTESLGVTKAIAKAVAKKIRKLQEFKSDNHLEPM